MRHISLTSATGPAGLRMLRVSPAIAFLLLLPIPAGAGTEYRALEARGHGSAGEMVEERESPRHLRLLRSQPAADSTVRAAPAQLLLWFSQRPELALTSARISAGNHTVATGPARLGDSNGEGVLVILPVSGRVEAGVNRVAWRTMAPDGHVVTGEFSFTLAPAGQASGD